MKKFKGFTLIELIIVMAIFGILMTGIVQMMKPIRSTYVDSTLYESQRSAQNGMVTYIAESIRYATDLGLYNESTASGAVSKFITDYANEHSVAESVVEDYIKKNAEIIVIDNTTAFSYNGGSYNGRILRRKNIGSASVSDAVDNTNFRLALGAAYYGERNCSITIEDGDPTNSDWKAEDGIKFTVTTLKTSGFDNRNSESQGIVSVTGEVVCKNLVSGGHGVKSAGMFKTDQFSSSTTGKTYIVFLNDSSKVPTA